MTTKEQFYNYIEQLHGKEYTERYIFENLKLNLRSQCYYAFKNIKLNKPCKTEKILGTDFYTLKLYLEKQFTDKMNWNNMGKYGWHIDHIKPISLAKNKDDLFILLNYKNLQPLWHTDNLKKSSIYKGVRVTYKSNLEWK